MNSNIVQQQCCAAFPISFEIFGVLKFPISFIRLLIESAQMIYTIFKCHYNRNVNIDATI